MRWANILLTLSIPFLFYPSISIAHSGSASLTPARPQTPQPLHTRKLCIGFYPTACRDYKIELRPLNEITYTIDRLNHMQRLASRSV